MEKKYWIRNKELNEGPFTLQEIVNSYHDGETYYWCENMDDWNQLKNLSEFATEISKNKIRKERKKTYKVYIVGLLFALLIFFPTEKLLSSQQKILISNYGADWYMQSLFEDYNLLIFFNLLSKYLIVLMLLLFISTKRKVMVLTTFVVTILFALVTYSSYSSINNSLANFGEKDLPGVNEIRSSNKRELDKINVKFENYDPNKYSTAHTEDRTGYYFVNASANNPVYFYSLPNKNKRKNSRFTSYEKVHVSDISNEFGFVEFVNTENDKSKGWILLSEMIPE